LKGQKIGRSKRKKEALRKFKNGLSFKQYIYYKRSAHIFVCVLQTMDMRREEKKRNGEDIYCMHVCYYIFIYGWSD
jgi:hypothetical protein